MYYASMRAQVVTSTYGSGNGYNITSQLYLLDRSQVPTLM